jgi:hypothetical protein
MILTDHEHFLLNLLKIGEGEKGLILPDKRYTQDATLQMLCNVGLVQRHPEPFGFHRYKVTVNGELQLRKITQQRMWKR